MDPCVRERGIVLFLLDKGLIVTTVSISNTLLEQETSHQYYGWAFIPHLTSSRDCDYARSFSLLWASVDSDCRYISGQFAAIPVSINLTFSSFLSWIHFPYIERGIVLFGNDTLSCVENDKLSCECRNNSVLLSWHYEIEKQSTFGSQFSFFSTLTTNFLVAIWQLFFFGNFFFGRTFQSLF